MMTAKQISALINYDPDTGHLTWRKRKGDDGFNTRCAGKPALSNKSDGYLVGTIMQKQYKSHRVAWAIYYGTWPSGQVDHINGDRSDNRISNLRDVNNAENGKNQRKRSTNSSGETCISWFRRDSKWHVKITVDGLQKHIGYFDRIEDAVKARDQAWKDHGFHANHGITR